MRVNPQTTVSLDKIDKNFKTPVTIGVSRTGPGLIRYRLTLVDQAGHDPVSVAGMWDSALASPLPDDLSLVGWQHRASSAIATLGEAHSLKSQPIK